MNQRASQPAIHAIQLGNVDESNGGFIYRLIDRCWFDLVEAMTQNTFNFKTISKTKVC